jgi:putative Mg2+ transporter-C (MgtC) family protein
MEFLNDHSIQNELLLIFISVVLGILIGAEREYRNKSAGLRTFILICFGSCLFTVLSVKIGIDDPDRIAANIITGIGFLGAGVIFKGDNKIDGITTATTIWATASIGMAVGSGYVYLAVLCTLLVLVILSSLTYFEKLIDREHKVREYKITVTGYHDLAYCEEMFRKHHLRFIISKQKYTSEDLTGLWIVTGKSIRHHALLENLMKDGRIIGYEF